ADFATVHYPGRAGIAWKLRQTLVIFLRLQLSAQGRVFFHGRAFAIVAIYPGRFRHKGTRKVARKARDATSFWALSCTLRVVDKVCPRETLDISPPEAGGRERSNDASGVGARFGVRLKMDDRL